MMIQNKTTSRERKLNNTLNQEANKTKRKSKNQKQK